VRWFPWRRPVRSLEDDIDEEVSYHLERLESEFRDQGLSPDAARVAAQKQFGASRRVRTQALDEARLSRFEGLSGDLKAAARAHWRSPGFSVLALATLSGGLCAAAVLFSITYHVLWRPPSYPNGDRIAVVWDLNLRPERADSPLRSAAAANYADWKTESHEFAAMAALRRGRGLLQDSESSETVTTARVSADLMQVLGAAPLLGRWLLPEEDISGTERVVVLSHSLWRRRYGGDPAILGRDIQLDGQPHRVVGVMPGAFTFPPMMRFQEGFVLQPGDVWLPLGRQTSASSRTSRNLWVFGLLAPGATAAAADAELNVVADRLRSQYPESNLESAVRVVTLRDQLVATVRPTLWMLMAGVGLLVILTCANLSSLLLAGLIARSHEMATRIALGAGRRRLIRQLISENLLLTLVSGAIGLALASRILVMLPILLPADFPRLADIRLDSSVVLFVLFGAVVSGVLVAGAPVFLIARMDPQALLREGGRNNFGSLQQARMRGLMISSQIAIAVTLLVGGSLLVKSLLQVQRVDPGFDTDDLLVMQLNVPPSLYPAPEALRLLYRGLEERVMALPGVHAATVAARVPFSQVRSGWAIDIEGDPVDPNPLPSAGYHNVGPLFFRTMAIPLQRGRSFDATDTPDGPPVAVVSETFVAENWPNQDPLGKRFRLGDPERTDPWITVIGVVGPIRHSALEVTAGSDFYLCDCQRTPQTVHFVVRTDGSAMRAASAVRAEVARQSKFIAVQNVTTMNDMIKASLTDRRIGAFLVAFLAVSALILASLGLYAVLSHAVAQRTREIGLRVAVGASSHEVAMRVLRQGMWMIVPGLAAGLVVSAIVSGALRALLWQMSPYDPAIFTGIPILLCVVAAVAVSIPAIRAARLDPIRALRSK
jgi:putative ABC transport system permease protein